MNSNRGLDALVGELRQLLSPPTEFTSGARVYFPEDDEPDHAKHVKNGLISEANEVIDSPRRWAKQWDTGRSVSESEINAYVAAAEREDFHRLDSILQGIFELSRPTPLGSPASTAAKPSS